MSASPILQFLFSTDWNVLNEALKIQPVHEHMIALSAIELPSLVKDKKTCLIISSVRGKNDLVQLATMVKIMKGNRECLFKLVVVNFSGNKQIEKAIAKLGIQDVIEEKINTKALKFKMDFWIKALNVQLKNNTALKEVKTLKAIENNAAKPVEKKVPDHIPVWSEPMDCENDIWILRNDTDCKKILTRWMVKFMGPSPYIGSWTEVPNRTGYWKFDIRPEVRDEFMSSEGNWYFKGDQKPDFIWKENTWLITGSSFDLFHQANDYLQSRVKLENRQLTIAKNSDFAKTKEEIITNSFDKDLVFRKEAKNLGGTEAIDGIETERLKSLSGKGKTDKISQKDLSGKGSTSDLSSNPLSMELKNNDGDVGGHQLSQKGFNSKTSSTMSGKVSQEDVILDDEATLAQDKHRDGSQLGMENKNKNHEKYLRGHNEAEKFEASDSLGKKAEKFSEESAEGMSGKSSTDKINGHLGSPQKDREAKAATEAKDGLSGKSSTDKINGHLGSPQKDREAKAAAEAKDALGGKSSTDKIDGHLGTHQKEKEAEAKDGLGGKSSTDKLNGHMSGKTGDKNSASHPDLEKEAKEIQAREKAEKLSPPKKEEKEREEKEKSPLEESAKGPLSGKSDTDKLDGHMGSRTSQKAPAVSGKVDGQFKDEVQSGKSKSEFDKAGVQESATLYSLAKAREEKIKNTNDVVDEEEEIRQATEDAKVSSVIIRDNKWFNCNLDDFFEGKIIFSTPDAGLEAKEKINLDLSFNYFKKVTKIAFEAAIETVESDGDGTNFITVKLSPKDIQTFESFMGLYKTRQENVNVFLKKVKGF